MTVADTQDISVVQKVRSLFEAARSKRRPRLETWNRNYRLVNNRGWNTLRESWMPAPQASEIYPIVAALAGWMTDQRPHLSVTPAMDPHTPYHDFYAQMGRDLEITLQASWMVNLHDAEVEKVLFDTMIYGTGFFKVCWDAARAGGLGDALLKRVDPFMVYPDPHATSFDDANYVIEARNMSLQELDRRWPGSAALLEDDAGIDLSRTERREDLFGNGRDPMANPGGVSNPNGAFGLPVTSNSDSRWGRVGAGGSKTDSFLYDKGVTVYECWMRENNAHTNDEGDVYIEDAWRVVVTAGNHVLMDEPAAELFGHGRHPYVRYQLHDLGEFWGISLVEHLSPLQISINRLLAALQSNAELIGNPVFVEDTRSGIPRTKIVNKPGQRLTKNAGSEVGWLTPPEMPAFLQQLVQFYIGEMERVSGLSAIVRGATPAGRNAQGVLDAVQESAFVRVRLALRNLERALREAGELLASLIVENYTAPRIVSIVGPEGQQQALSLKARHFFLATHDGEVPLEFQLWVQAGSSLPISRMARAQEADMLFAMGGIDREALLDAHDYPNRTAIEQRIMQQEAAGMFNPPGARQKAGRTT